MLTEPGKATQDYGMQAASRSAHRYPHGTLIASSFLLQRMGPTEPALMLCDAEYDRRERGGTYCIASAAVADVAAMFSVQRIIEGCGGIVNGSASTSATLNSVWTLLWMRGRSGNVYVVSDRRPGWRPSALSAAAIA